MEMLNVDTSLSAFRRRKVRALVSVELVLRCCAHRNQGKCATDNLFVIEYEEMGKEAIVGQRYSSDNTFVHAQCQSETTTALSSLIKLHHSNPCYEPHY